MKTVAAAVMLFSFAPILQACSPPKKADGNLQVKQVGADVIVSTTVDSNGTGHVVLTSYDIDANKHVTLKYCMIQSEVLSRLDILARVKVEWRLTSVRFEDLSFEIQGSRMIVSLEQIRQLRNQLNKALHEEQNKPRRDAELRIGCVLPLN